MPSIAASVERVPRSRIRELAEIAMTMDGVLRLYFGESNLPTPEYIKQAAGRAASKGSAQAEKIVRLENKLQQKNEVIAELLEENVRAKKAAGEL